MKIGIMQPYFVPYIGYWQLMNAVDKYVVYDDVNFIKGGWINRNRILVNGEVKYFNVPMLGASPFKLINEVEVNNNVNLVEKNLRIIKNAYGKAPYFNEVFPVVEKIVRCNKGNLAEYNMESFYEINNYLGIKTELIMSSQIEKKNELTGQDKVLNICENLLATEYYNAIGGQELYSKEEFAKKNIVLKFLKTDAIVYKQFDNEFQSNLSIIDVLMFNSKDKVQEYLGQYQIV